MYVQMYAQLYVQPIFWVFFDKNESNQKSMPNFG